MNVNLIAKKMGCPANIAVELDATAKFFRIIHTDHWLAQIMVESGNFKRVKENLNYRPERLFELFKGRNGLRTIEEAKLIVLRGQDAIAEAIYGGVWGAKNLGNDKPGDGAKFIGRSFKQITGKYNYMKYSKDTYGDERCVIKPIMLELLPDSVKAAGHFWAANGLDKIAATGSVEAVTKKVNGGLNGLEERRANLGKIRRLVSV